MKEIQLTKGKVAKVDDADFDWLSQWKWSWHYAGYAFRMYRTHYTLHRVAMARAIMDLAASDKRVVDHINGDSLDNRRCNLRVCSRAENMRNVKLRRTSISGYKGVSHTKEWGWRVKLQVNGKVISGGTFLTSAEAAKAYDELAIKYHGEFARLNFPERISPEMPLPYKEGLDRAA
jgi:hypothetical protein